MACSLQNIIAYQHKAYNMLLRIKESILGFFSSRKEVPEMANHKECQPVSTISGSNQGIIFSPDWSYYNSYQKILYDSLNKLFASSAYGFNPEDFNIDCLKQYAKKCQVIHIHWINVFYDLGDKNSIESFIKTLRWAKKNNFTIIWTVHNFVSHESKDYDLEIEIRKKVSQIADHVIVHGEFAKNIICKEYGVKPEKVQIIPHGHYRGFYKNMISAAEAKKQLGIANNDYVFLFFGNIRAYKGLEELVEAFLRLQKKHSSITLLIAGRGLDMDIHEYIKEKVVHSQKIIAHIRFINDDDVQSYLNASDMMVLPYKTVLTSGAALLALSFMKPVIAPRIGLIPELIDENIGKLFDTYEEMEELMEACIANRDKNNWAEDHFHSKLQELDWLNLLDNSLFTSVLGRK